MRNQVPISCRPPSDSVNRAVAIAARVCRWRYDLSLQEHLKERLSYDKNTLTLHGITCEEDHRFEYDELGRSRVVVTKGLVTRSSTVLATFSVTGEVTVQQGKEHCLNLLVPCLVLASIVFPQAAYRVVWQRLVPSKVRCGDGKKTFRFHKGVGWKKEDYTCVAQSGKLTVESASLQAFIRFLDFYDEA